jgi:hypothetical protein
MVFWEDVSEKNVKILFARGAIYFVLPKKHIKMGEAGFEWQGKHLFNFTWPHCHIRALCIIVCINTVNIFRMMRSKATRFLLLKHVMISQLFKYYFNVSICFNIYCLKYIQNMCTYPCYR